jgi:hypothetical protein
VQASWGAVRLRAMAQPLLLPAFYPSNAAIAGILLFYRCKAYF